MVSGDMIKVSLSIGMIGGQLLFGLFADALGRHKMYGKELVVTIFVPDTLGRVRQQWILSLLVAVIYAVWAGVTNHISTGGLIALFVLAQLIISAGPNGTTFLIPAEAFPTRVRGTAHGVSAASGKVGTLITAFAFWVSD